MASSKSLHAKSPVWLVLLTLATFAFLDNAIFRSGLYERVESNKTVPGAFSAMVRYRVNSSASGKREVLVLGHSKIEAAFSAKQFDAENPDSNVKFVYGTSGGTTEKMWYFMLAHVDPHHDRFASIIIPQDQYRTPPLLTDAENLYDVAQVVAPLLTPREWQLLIDSYTNPVVKRQVMLGAAVSSHFYAVDIQDLLLHPVARYENLDWMRANVTTYLYDFKGFDGSMEGVALDPATKKLAWAPPHLDAFRRQEAESLFRESTPEQAKELTLRYAAFRKQWLSRIVDLYANSTTKLVFLQVPRWPFPMPLITPIADASNVRELVAAAPNVIFFDENEFVWLEQPKYFFDAFHTNLHGRRLFTHELGARMRTILEDNR